MQHNLNSDEVKNDTLTFTNIIANYFIRQNNFNTHISYVSENTTLLTVRADYNNIKDCKIADVYVTRNHTFLIEYILYEKYGNFKQKAITYIEDLPKITEWLRQPPSWVTESKKLQDKEDYKFIDYKFRGYPIALKETTKRISVLVKNKCLLKGNKIEFFKSEQEIRDFYWELVDWLNS